MKIVLDGLVFEKQSLGGITRIFTEILPIMCRLDPSLQIDLIAANPLKRPLPAHAQMESHRLNYWENFLRPGIFFQDQRKRGRQRALTNWVQKAHLDLMHSSYYTVPDNFSGPLIITLYDLIHEIFTESFSKVKQNQVRQDKLRALKSADAIICISKTTQNDLQNFYNIDSSKTVVIPLGVNPVFHPMISDNQSLATQKPFIMFVGRRSGYKNFITLLEAYSRWSLRNEIYLVVVGSGWSKIERQQLIDLNIERNVILKTAVTDRDLAQLYNQALSYISPSLYEGFGLTIAEAMSCGCPVIVSDIPSSREIAGDAAVYFQPESIEDLLESLNTAVNESRSSQRVKEGIQIASSLTWERCASQTLDLYHEIC